MRALIADGHALAREDVKSLLGLEKHRSNLMRKVDLHSAEELKKLWRSLS